jgi:hypothetical protein
MLRRFSQSKFHFDFEDDSATGIASLALLIPLFAKNSRLGYFFNANNLTQSRLQIQSPDLKLETVFMLLHIKFVYANLAFYSTSIFYS